MTQETEKRAHTTRREIVGQLLEQLEALLEQLEALNDEERHTILDSFEVALRHIIPAAARKEDPTEVAEMIYEMLRYHDSFGALPATWAKAPDDPGIIIDYLKPHAKPLLEDEEYTNTIVDILKKMFEESRPENG